MQGKFVPLVYICSISVLRDESHESNKLCQGVINMLNPEINNSDSKLVPGGQKCQLFCIFLYFWEEEGYKRSYWNMLSGFIYQKQIYFT